MNHFSFIIIRHSAVKKIKNNNNITDIDIQDQVETNCVKLCVNNL